LKKKEKVSVVSGSSGEVKGIKFVNHGKNDEIYFFPIFSSVYSEFISENKEDNNAIYFICTDQKNEKDNKKDTVYLFKILEYFLKELLKSKWSVEPFYFDGDPTDMEKAIDNIKNLKIQILENTNNLDKQDFKVIYGPGVPTVNYSLILNFFDFPYNLEFYYAKFLSELGTTKLQSTPIYGVLNPFIIKNSIKNLIGKYNYIAAYNILSELNLKEELMKARLFLEVLYYYMLFRFDEAKEKLALFKKEYSFNKEEEEELYKLLESEIKTLANNLSNEYKLLIPLINIMQIYFKSGMFNEWISLVFRLEEEFGKLVVEKLLGLEKIEKDKSGKFNAFKEAIDKEPNLKKYLEENKIRYDEPNRVVYKKITEYFKNTQNTDKRFENMKNIIGYYNELIDFLNEAAQDGGMKLSDLRNNSPFAHGFTGISEQLLKQYTKWYTESVLDRLVDLSIKLLRDISDGKVVQVKHINDKDFPFKKINTLLQKIYLE